MASSANKGQVTLTQMLRALDEEVAGKVSKKLQKLSKKKKLEVPNELDAARIERKTAYSEVSQEVSKWDPIVKRNRQTKIKFPLDQQPDVLTSSAVANFKPRNEFEEEIQNESVSQLDDQEFSQSEKKYLKAISAEEAKERLKQMQKTRILLNTFGAKMRRQNKIKSKSYRRLLKQQRIRTHVKKVESDKDKLLDEIERLKTLRAQERASLRHKNTGKWAKHAKFRAKYDEEARNALLEQIGVASKLLGKPAVPQSDSDESQDEEADDDSVSESGEDSVHSEEEKKDEPTSANDRLIVSSELTNDRSAKKRKASTDGGDDDDDDDDEGDDDEDEQRKLMSEAFANDDVVGEFKKLKSQLADEEQPKDIDLFLPGWGDWAGPGIKVNRRKRKKYIIKADKVDRKDESLSNVIISERANDEMKELQVKKLPRGIKSDKHLTKILAKPVTSTFVDESSHREITRPNIETRLGARIEPISRKVLQGGNKAKWAQ